MIAKVIDIILSSIMVVAFIVILLNLIGFWSGFLTSILPLHVLLCCWVLRFSFLNPPEQT